MNKPKLIARTRFLPFVFVLWLALLGCTPIRPTPGNSGGQASAGALMPGLAVVDTIQVNQQETEPAQIPVVVQGNLPDGCTQLGPAAAPLLPMPSASWPTARSRMWWIGLSEV